MSDNEIEKVIKDLKDYKVVGNTNIAKTVAKTLLDFVTHYRHPNFDEFVAKVKQYGKELANARPNEPMAVNAVAFITNDLESAENQQQLRIKVIDRIENFFKYIDESFEQIQLNAVKTLKNYHVFFTHCNSTLVRDVLLRVYQIDQDILVITDECRPQMHGRTSALKLAEHGVKVVHVLDSMVASMFLDDRYATPDVSVIGCDGISLKGDIVAKVGAFNAALAAYEAGVPLYVVAQSMKIDIRTANQETQIEMRDESEVWEGHPREIEVLNPAFDLIPAKFITGGIITEKGLMKPEDFKNLSR